ncbi:YaaL family protein [Lederbergia sp. NSJ-179]|uniref:YaaL family protein n=1 Tax=Lederbergia sp. NSJ-179 TaxID=2931402 RepID=UPI001FD49A74|nr:YaaL family protein [Lederbergia sp. NSJ-179]MCJ7842935.1 YaaL family protein [Lederbergia sp. NSJ-179]
MFQKEKLREEYNQRLIELMQSTKKDWLYFSQLEDMSYGYDEELHRLALLAKSKYFFLFQEAKKRKISIR